MFPAYLAAERLGQRWARAGTRSFARAAGRLALRRGAGALAFDTNATETFRVLEGRGLPCILDQSIAHRRWRERMEQEECERFPAWVLPQEGRVTPAELVAEEEEGLARADLILCGSEFCASTMVSEGVAREKLEVAEYGTNTDRFSPAPERMHDSAAVRLLFVGSLVLRKGVPYLLEAVRRVQALGVRLTVAGLRRVRQEALVPYAPLLDARGTLLHGQMPDLYRSHDLYVFPSLVEGSTYSIYEALASGLPVITTPNAGSIVRDGVEGLIVPPRDVDALEGAIETLVRNPGLRVEMGKAARRRALEYGDWQHYGARLVNSILARFPSVSRRTRGTRG